MTTPPDESGPTEPNGQRPAWDATLALRLIGKRVLVGLTWLDHNGVLLGHTQMHGRVAWARPDAGVGLRLEGEREGEDYVLPPDLTPFTPAATGHYRLRGTGEVVVDPDFTATWTVTAPPPVQ